MGNSDRGTAYTKGNPNTWRAFPTAGSLERLLAPPPGASSGPPAIEPTRDELAMDRGTLFIRKHLTVGPYISGLG